MTQAQMLNLSGPDLPAPGDGTAALREARILLEESAALAEQDHRARAMLRRIAARAIRIGDEAEPDGSALVVLGLTLRSHLPSLDTRLEEAPSHIVLAIASDLERLLADSPSDVRRWEQALQFALAPLVDEPLPETWISDQPNDLSASLERLEELRSLFDGEPRRRQSIVRTLTAARAIERWPAFASSISHEAALITKACEAVLADAPWMAAATRDRLAADLDLALTEESAVLRQARLHVLALDAELIQVLGSLPRDGNSRDLRERFLVGIATRSAAPDATLEALPRAISTLRATQRISALPHERELVRELRLLHRALLPELRRRAAPARESAVILATDPEHATDPGVLTALASFDQASQVASGLIDLNGILRDADGGVPTQLRGVADRVQSLGRDAGNAETQAEAFQLFEKLLEQRRQTSVIAELLPEAVRGRSASDQITALVARANSARALWNSAWSVPGGTGMTPEQIASVNEITRLLACMADLSADVSGLRFHPWWELTETEQSAASTELSRMITRYLAGTADLSRELTAFESDHAVRLLAGRLSRLHPSPAARDLGEIVQGPPSRGARLAEDRELIASVNRYAFELQQGVSDAVISRYVSTLATDYRRSLPLAP